MLLLKTGPQASLGAGPLAPAEFTFLCDDGPPADWHVRNLEFVEALSEPYRLTLELLTADLAVDPDLLLGARCTLQLHRGADGRAAHGLITRVRTLGVASGRLRVGVDIEPALALLADRTDTRFWQDRTAADILRDVLHAPLRELGCALDLRLGAADLATREYCVQYRESDLDFAARLMHEEGLVYYFTHSPDDAAETLVVVDSTANAPELVHPLRAVPFVPRHTGAAHCQTLAAFDWQSRLGTTAVALRDWDWQDTEASPFARARDGKDLRGRVRARFAHDERRLHRDDGARRARLDLEGRTATLDRGAGDSDVVEMLPGHVVTLQGLERPDLDGDYLLIRVTHRGDAPDEERFAADRPRAPRYANSFECIRRNTPFRAPTAPARPRVHGPHTAIVVGPPGEEIHTDEHGRIKVRFHWDRRSPPDDTASCWIRVAQSAAGAGWGGLFLPRVGMEVLVEFIDGDPDRPLVTGCVYNGLHRPPYPLPDHKSRSTIKSESTPGGGGFNELRFEDAKGSEELFIHAQRDLNEVALHDNTRTVGHDQTLAITANQRISVGGNQSITVTGDRNLTVEQGDETTTITAGNSTTTVHGHRMVIVEEGEDTLIVDKGGHSTTVERDFQIVARDGLGSLKSCESMRITSQEKDIELKGRKQAWLHSTESSLLLQGHTDVTLSSDTTKIEISAPNEIGIMTPGYVGIDGDTLQITARTRLELRVGASLITLEPAGITISAPKISSTAAGIHEIGGALIKLN
jgi:type VI secretion system secreted protein VgrG